MSLSEPKTYLVTGGAGFIGSNYVKFLINEYDRKSARIVVLDAMTYAANPETLAREIEKGDIIFVHGNINDDKLVNNIFAEFNPDYVVNFAAETHVDRSITNPRVFIETNVSGTQTLLEAARKSWIEEKKDLAQKKFLQVSTDEVYGSLQRDFDTPKAVTVASDKETLTFGNDMFTEETPLAPRSPYSAAKASADMLVSAYGETYGLPVVITRCSNNYGPYQFPEKLIPLLINNLRLGKPLPVYGKGINVRDWLFVEDHVRAIEMALKNGRDGNVYNIGGLNEKENISIVRTVIDQYAALTDTPPRHDLIKFVTDRPGHDMRYAINPAKIMSELGWRPLTDFDSGIKSTIEWYLANNRWIEVATSGQYNEYYSKMYDNR